MKEQFFCGLDLGAHRLKAGVLKVNNPESAQLIEIHEGATAGFKDGVVHDLGEFSECIYNAVSSVLKNAKVKLKGIQLGLNGEFVQARQASAMIPLTDKGSKVITTYDLKRVNKHNRLLSLKMEEETLHEILQSYQVNEENPTINPVGLYGRKLGVSAVLILTEVNRIRNLTRAVHEAGYDVSNILFSSYVATKAVLSDREIKEGCVFIDMGAAVTSILIFHGGVLKYLERIPVAGRHLTQSIADKLNLPFELAQQIKESYAVALKSHQHLDEEILIKRENAYIPIKRALIYEAIEPDINQLIKKIQSAIESSGYADKIKNRIILVGGTTLLTGLIERIGQDTGYQAELGKIHIPIQKNMGDLTVFAGVAGLAWNGYERSIKDKIILKGKISLKQQLSHKLKELYEDYF
ncbi:MAG: cell division protein FtsA [Candidatus Omnitrophica bacterium]|nr:cell division protein FtsA [Candidatus Omnitrophota bacterium]